MGAYHDYCECGDGTDSSVGPASGSGRQAASLRGSTYRAASGARDDYSLISSDLSGSLGLEAGRSGVRGKDTRSETRTRLEIRMELCPQSPLTSTLFFSLPDVRGIRVGSSRSYLMTMTCDKAVGMRCSASDKAQYHLSLTEDCVGLHECVGRV
ncbi:hypothetical protein DAEQUDRAFT_597519 [Daedalea quercina L-15889]|uniref:Uncharacterized protein n=1 Tax=Daedalea quercina L-15889 TaxID=1314783 RepID=A0A165SZU9_9APHY|nr:hypothetical protein DAEQUDRAFT_597519 [Daedalea quercina L-15889]